MTKNEHIRYWLATAEKDWQRAELLFENKDYVFALFCIHLSIEKIIKACWVKDNVKNEPPKVHNLLYLISKTKQKLDVQQLKILDDLNMFQLEGRYPDYQLSIYKFASKEETMNIINQSKKIKICLLKNLQ